MMLSLNITASNNGLITCLLYERVNLIQLYNTIQANKEHHLESLESKTYRSQNLYTLRICVSVSRLKIGSFVEEALNKFSTRSVHSHLLELTCSSFLCQFRIMHKRCNDDYPHICTLLRSRLLEVIQQQIGQKEVTCQQQTKMSIK